MAQRMSAPNVKPPLVPQKSHLIRDTHMAAAAAEAAAASLQTVVRLTALVAAHSWQRLGLLLVLRLWDHWLPRSLTLYRSPLTAEPAQLSRRSNLCHVKRNDSNWTRGIRDNGWLCRTSYPIILWLTIESTLKMQKPAPRTWVIFLNRHLHQRPRLHCRQRLYRRPAPGKRRDGWDSHAQRQPAQLLAVRQVQGISRAGQHDEADLSVPVRQEGGRGSARQRGR